MSLTRTKVIGVLPPISLFQSRGFRMPSRIQTKQIVLTGLLAAISFWLIDLLLKGRLKSALNVP